MKLKLFFLAVFHFVINPARYLREMKRQQSFDEIGAKLEKALLRKRKEQYALEHKMRVHLRRFLKVGADSKFIPLDSKSNFEIRNIVEKKYGKEMKRLDMSLNEHMQIEKL